MPDRLLPEPREALRLLLRELPSLTPVVGTRIGVTLADDRPSIRLSNQGGKNSYEWLEALVLVECWGKANAPDDGAASLTARTIIAELPRLRGPVAGGYVAGVHNEGGYSDSYDPQTKRPRVMMSVRLYAGPPLQE